jgi:hypothetical protein
MTTGRINQVASVQRRARRRAGGKRVPPTPRRAPPGPPRRGAGVGCVWNGRVGPRSPRRAMKQRRRRPPARHGHNLPAPSSTGSRSGTETGRGRRGGGNRRNSLPGRKPHHRRPRRGSVAAGHASRGSGYRRPEIPKDRSRLCPPLPMAIHPQTAPVPAAGKGDRAWGDVVARLEQPPPPPTPPSPDGERGGERSCPGPNAASKNRTCQPASRRCHPVTDAPLFAGHGRRSSRNRSAARDARRPSNEDPSRRLTPAECNRCTGPQAGAGASSAEARAPRATPPAGAGSAARHDGTGRPETRRKEPRAVCPGHGTGTRIRPLPPTAARPET